jgi:hypothetical protein
MKIDNRQDFKDQSQSAATYLQRNNWAKALTADRSQKMTARVIGGALGRRFKVGAGGVCACIVSYDDLAKDAGCSRSTAIVAVDQLRGGGWLAPATSSGRAANNFTLLVPSNGVTVYTVAGATCVDQDVDREKSNGVTVHTPLKDNLQEVVSEQESQKGHRPALALSMTRESNAANSVTGTSASIVETAGLDAPIAPALSADDDIKKARETAHKAARLSADDYLHPEQRPEFSLQAASYQMGRGARRNGGLLIDETGNVLDEIDDIETPPPKAGARTYGQEIYGDSP